MDADGQDDPARPAGRRGHGGRVLAWAPGLSTSDGEVGPVDAAAGEDDDLGDQDGAIATPGRLGELDLAANPVSVTPPRTWRRAAWFAVGASCVVLIVLAFAASRLASDPAGRIDAFPGLPTGGLLTAQPLGPPASTPTVTTAPGGGIATEPSGGTGAGGDRAGSGDRPGGGTGGRPPADPGGTAGPGESAPAPAVSYLPVEGHPPVGPQQLADATVQFYELLQADVEAAWELVGPKVKARGYDSFRGQWAGAVGVEVQQLVVNADASTVVATVALTAADGTTRVQQYELVFRRGSTQIIEEINPIAKGGQKPAR